MSLPNVIPFDEQFYDLGPKEVEYLKEQTGIDDDDSLKAHILQVQQKAYNEYPYPCILYFTFMKFTISDMPVYSSILELCRTRQNAIFLEFGCCLGSDIRRVVADGWPAHQVIGSDMRQAFWDFGHELYRSTPETFTATCLVGDVLDPAFLPAGQILSKAPDTPCPNFQSLTSCFPLAGRVAVIYVARFFHLFDEKKQLELAFKLAALLAPEPGSTIFGTHIGIPERPPGNILEPASTFFCHSPESWRELWEKVFVGHAVKIDATVSPVPDNFRKAGGSQEYVLKWSVVRL
ncbi:hypothetical protein HYPSUDRAFT_48362 [Hypholoma sublateritium FD-334 SS-4]|uniref:Methyltransferase domain-containing protein n=1 Tax=Hypholoma sublateritium (strain FD-334 SS-4) TaxID=945553 RepID=A0A0D2KLD0_HYPSF|nr:hypothetical protein HYPSUDRAFT_48362 [Hypholoma sublateritium FD-334 SS-4]